MASTPVSPKVHAAGVSVAAVTLVMYLLDQIPAVAAMPATAKGAVLVIVTALVSYGAGWLAKDPLRNLGAAFDNNPATAPSRNEKGAVDALYLAVLVLVVVVILVLLGVV